MIKFGKNNKVENLGILEKEEAEAYVWFLQQERERHICDIEEALGLIGEIEGFHRPEENIGPIKLLWQSAIRRHKKDIEDIDVLVATLKHRYGI